MALQRARMARSVRARFREGRRSETAALARYCADRLCLWYLCGKPACSRAHACRGDIAACARLLVAWLAALEGLRNAAPTFADMEARIETPAEMRLYRQWREILARAEDSAKMPPAETALLRDRLRRQIEALPLQGSHALK